MSFDRPDSNVCLACGIFAECLTRHPECLKKRRLLEVTVRAAIDQLENYMANEGFVDLSGDGGLGGDKTVRILPVWETCLMLKRALRGEA